MQLFDFGYFLQSNPWLVWIILLWSLPWKGMALWKAAKLSHKIWFIAILVSNTLAILDILYIYVFSKKIKGAIPQPK